jgi:hypothetical protein
MQVHIKKEEKHAERMTVRAKYMTMHPSENKYVRNLASIRTIQDYLVHAADKRCVPRVSNSNVDVSVGVIHSTLLRALQRCAVSTAQSSWNVFASPCSSNKEERCTASDACLDVRGMESCCTTSFDLRHGLIR